MLSPLKRHPVLQPLSRDHVIALHQAELLKKSAHYSVQDQDSVVSNFARVWAVELAPHFEDEERILPQFIRSTELLNKLYDDHQHLRRQVRRLIDAEEIQCSLLRQLGESLEAHVRWEEHILFPQIESGLDESTVELLQIQTAAVEQSRYRETGKYSRTRQ